MAALVVTGAAVGVRLVLRHAQAHEAQGAQPGADRPVATTARVAPAESQPVAPAEPPAASESAEQELVLFA